MIRNSSKLYKRLVKQKQHQGLWVRAVLCINDTVHSWNMIVKHSQYGLMHSKNAMSKIFQVPFRFNHS